MVRLYSVGISCWKSVTVYDSVFTYNTVPLYDSIFIILCMTSCMCRGPSLLAGTPIPLHSTTPLHDAKSPRQNKPAGFLVWSMSGLPFMDLTPTYKVLLLGDTAVGKTCLLTRYCEGEFQQSFISTIGEYVCCCGLHYVLYQCVFIPKINTDMVLWHSYLIIVITIS